MERTIIVVDDDLLTLKSLEILFSREGYRTLTAENADEALKILEQEKIDGVISDELMPGLKGKEFLTVVRERESLWHANDKKELPGVLRHDESVSQYRTAAFACVPVKGGKTSSAS